MGRRGMFPLLWWHGRRRTQIKWCPLDPGSPYSKVTSLGCHEAWARQQWDWLDLQPWVFLQAPATDTHSWWSGRRVATGRPRWVLEPALGLMPHPVPGLSPPPLNSATFWVLPWKSSRTSGSSGHHTGADRRWRLHLRPLSTWPYHFTLLCCCAPLPNRHAVTPCSIPHPEAYTGSGTKPASAFGISIHQNKTLCPLYSPLPV